MNDYRKVAHRGRHEIHVENTLEAFGAAYASGCEMVEFDVQLSRDGVPVIFHDDDCRRLAGRGESVFDLTWAELRKLELRRQPGRQGEPAYRMPSLEEFLAEYGKRPYYLELKIPRAVERIQGYYETLGEQCARMALGAGAHPDTFLASFHAGILRFLAREKLFPVLGGIFEDYARFREVHSGADAETAAAIRYFSVSWDIFKRHARECQEIADRNALQAQVRPSELELLERRAPGVPDAELFLIWDIHGETEFAAALSEGVRALVADDVELMIRMGLEPGRPEASAQSCQK
jgi:glycerophosphoryl diester phosphodiesterase